MDLSWISSLPQIANVMFPIIVLIYRESALIWKSVWQFYLELQCPHSGKLQPWLLEPSRNATKKRVLNFYEGTDLKKNVKNNEL